MIEQGRYKKLEIDKRLCPTCQTDIETENHFIMRCPKYNEKREALFEKIHAIIPSFDIMSEEYKFAFIMQSNEYDIGKLCVVSIGAIYCDRINTDHG